jgi:hypothetical protein
MEERVRDIPVHRIAGEPENAFQQCAACGQHFDKQSDTEVQRHKEPGHIPFTEAELREFAAARNQAR